MPSFPKQLEEAPCHQFTQPSMSCSMTNFNRRKSSSTFLKQMDLRLVSNIIIASLSELVSLLHLSSWLCQLFTLF